MIASGRKPRTMRGLALPSPGRSNPMEEAREEQQIIKYNVSKRINHVKKNYNLETAEINLFIKFICLFMFYYLCTGIVSFNHTFIYYCVAL